MEKVASLEEVDTHWSLEDVLNANIALDALAEADRQQQQAQAAKNKGR